MNAVAAALLTFALGPWMVAFNSENGQLTMTHQEQKVSVTGTLQLHSEGKTWKLVAPQDNVPQRLAFADQTGFVYAYVTFQQNGDRLDLLVHHRTRQFFSGTWSFDGDIVFRPESFPCRVNAVKGERVLTLGSGHTDSLLNDSLFARDEDLLLRVAGADVNLSTRTAGHYGVKVNGQIEESSAATFGFHLEPNYFKTRYVPYYAPIDRKRCPKPPTGWMSWNIYFDKATAEDNLLQARVGKKYLQPFGMEFWSIESWQGNSDQLPVSKFYNLNLEVNAKQFPKGMKQLAADIRALGFRPGIWMAPFGTGNEEFYNTHRNWFLHDKQGKPMKTWNGIYTIDPTNPAVQDHLRKIFDVASHDWGYEFFKIDGMSAGPGYCAHFYEHPNTKAAFMNPQCPDPFEQCVRSFREGIGPDRVFLACQGHVTGPEAAYADASRIGADIVHPNKPVGWKNLYQQAGRTLNQIFTHNIVFYADPDTLLVNDALSMEEARLSTTVVGLPGQLMFAGDKLDQLPMERMRLLQQVLPVADVHPMELYPFFSMLPVWDLKVAKSFLNWDVVALFNWEEQEAGIPFTFKELGLDPNESYVLYEFWTNRFLGVVRDTFSMNVPSHAVRLLAVHRLAKHPQFLSSDRHITQGDIDLLDLNWNEQTKELNVAVKLVEKNKTTLRFYLPEGFDVKKVSSIAGVQVETKTESDGRVAAVSLESPTTKDVKFVATF